MSLGLSGIIGLRRYVHDLNETRSFFVEQLDFRQVGVSATDVDRQDGERSAAFRAGGCTVVCTEPVVPESRAARYLERHPEGIGAILIEVDDARTTFEHIIAQGGTPTAEVAVDDSSGVRCEAFSIATPMPDLRFEFVAREESHALPWIIPAGGEQEGNRHGFGGFDHITINHQTMTPAILWFKHVFGMTQYWDIEFHAAGNQSTDAGPGTGLRSVVVWDEASGIKFANNEPLQPNFEGSQVALFCRDHGGAGVQHTAIEIDDILGSVGALRKRGVRFVEPPVGYYDRLSGRLEGSGIILDEDLDALQRTGVLADGSGPNRYLLQIFMEDAARLAGDPKKSPFFFELIQRKGEQGFGEGNFRALFDGVAAAQRGRSISSMKPAMSKSRRGGG